ncbi:MAG: Crp/Fnr family transcriptional regulator [Nitrospirae bacterium]|nr:Crp/Fnr family transcriptional regulator [Nitrospirota bacterium]MBF0592441.1 Crp/Fnr family transcriptional regulator [Nitrospirota bacterium]
MRGKVTKVKDHDSSLQCLPCLSAFSVDELSVIEGKSIRKKCCRNDYVFWEGDETRFVFVVESGSIKLFKTSEEGREIVIRIMKEGDYFCCVPLHADRKNMVSAVAIEDTSLIVIPAESFHEAVYAGLTPMGIKMLSTLCNRVKHLSSIIENLTFKDVVKRVLIILLDEANAKDPNNNIVTLSLTHQEMASMIGTVREVVSRTMSKLRKGNIVFDSTSREFKVNKQLIIEAMKQA